MACIKQNTEQQKALEEVSQMLNQLNELAKVAPGEFDSVTITFSHGEGRGRRGVKIELDAEEKDAQRALAIVTDFRRRLIKDIREKAKKFDICFDEEEENLLEGNPRPARAKRSPKTDEAADTTANEAVDPTTDTEPAQEETPASEPALETESDDTGEDFGDAPYQEEEKTDESSSFGDLRSAWESR